jgi:transcriptional regulator with XRE-family HTH domain
MGISQAEAARRAGWSTPIQWLDVEKGKRPDPRISTVVKVAGVLGCKVDQLLKK